MTFRLTESAPYLLDVLARLEVTGVLDPLSSDGKRAAAAKALAVQILWDAGVERRAAEMATRVTRGVRAALERSAK